jgi:hypothetical protein
MDGGYASGAGLADADRNYKVALVGPILTKNSKQAKAKDGFTKENFIIDFDRHDVTCPNGKVSGHWNEIPRWPPTRWSDSASASAASRAAGRSQVAVVPVPVLIL